MIPHVALMLKAPRPGSVKTRLAASTGPEQAVRIYRTLVEHQIGEIPSDWSVAIHYDPAGAREEMEAWLGPLRKLRFHPQPDGDLGARLTAAVRTGLSPGTSPVLLLGGDCPTLLSPNLREAVDAAQQEDVVIAPAIDGGYVLLATKILHPALFTGIPWSTDQVLRLTCQQARAAGLSVRLLDTHEDIDDGTSWSRWRHLFPGM
jgi:rSAM/selenodomain-associated transferase 1